MYLYADHTCVCDFCCVSAQTPVTLSWCLSSLSKLHLHTLHLFTEYVCIHRLMSVCRPL